MKTFEINKTYSTRSICDSECVFSYIILKRTSKTVTIQSNNGEVKTCRINKKLSEYKNVETILPEGNYSMAPIITAE